MTNDYYFLTHWRIQATAEEIYDIISRPHEYPRWWPSVYLDTHELEPGDEHGLGHRVRLHTKGWLPYTLRWESCATGTERPHRLVVSATGDFNGRGVWTFEQDAEFVNVSFDWMLTAEKPALRNLSFLLKPAFEANHRWAMERGRESLELELARRRAKTPEERERIPAPPGPNKTSGLWLGLGAVTVIGLAIAAARKSSKD